MKFFQMKLIKPKFPPITLIVHPRRLQERFERAIARKEQRQSNFGQQRGARPVEPGARPVGCARPVRGSPTVQKNNGRDPSEGRDPLKVVRDPLNHLAANFKQITSNSFQAINLLEVGALNMD